MKGNGLCILTHKYARKTKNVAQLPNKNTVQVERKTH